MMTNCICVISAISINNKLTLSWGFEIMNFNFWRIFDCLAFLFVYLAFLLVCFCFFLVFCLNCLWIDQIICQIWRKSVMSHFPFAFTLITRKSACLTSRYLGNKTSVRRWGFYRDSAGCVRRAWSSICPGICCTWKQHNRCVSYTRSYTPLLSGCVLWSSWCLLQLGSSPSADSLGSWKCYLF